MPRTGNVELDVQELYESLMWILPAINPDLGKIEPPDRYKRTGLVAWADGSTWDPGAGAGNYIWTGAAWSKLADGTQYTGITVQSSANPWPGDTATTRALGTVYQNTGGKQIWVRARCTGSATTAILGYSDSNNPPTTLADENDITNGVTNTILFPVLLGNYYKVAATANLTLNTWTEWA